MNSAFKGYLAELIQYMQSQGVNVYPLPKVVLNTKPQEGPSIYNNTGYYNPQEKMVVLFTFGRHEKDVLRSFTHEMYHHHQNLNGEMTEDKVGESTGDPKYTQNNKHLRKIEAAAYKHGNLLLRDWTDHKKYKK